MAGARARHARLVLAKYPSRWPGEIDQRAGQSANLNRLLILLGRRDPKIWIGRNFHTLKRVAQNSQ
jgi:hypothetical protein